jgi:DNA-binding HxlR family transcriptional regulator
MKESLASIQRRIRLLSKPNKIHVLRGLISGEKKRSFMRAQLEAMLKPIVNDQIRREVRDERKASA